MSAPRLRAKLASTTAPAPTASEKDETMKGKKGAKGEEGSPEEEETETPGEEEQEQKKGVKKGATAASAKPADPAKARMKAITTGAGSKAFPTLAFHLAYDSDLSAEDAEAVMAAALQDVDTSAAEPAHQREAGDSPKGAAFAKAMKAEAPNPTLGAGGNAASEPEDAWLAAAKKLGVA